eukprot:NODE_1_length_95616_cov_0.657642.p48 type:complete len:227 gc:universal NODE_1_length_95616_cov_0.657642:78989-78309(-)
MRSLRIDLPLDMKNESFQRASKSGCPHHNKKEEINPNNLMPEYSQEKDPDQTVELSKKREISTIPKSEHADGPGSNSNEENWSYPSPQQFYHALKKKDMAAPEESIESMVDIHNFLNEEVWKEILKWESEYKGVCPNPKLLRFQGKASSPTWKSKWVAMVHNQHAFDRHDWIIDRCGRHVRYVIDYYEGEEENDNPTFYCDVRPAFDSPQAAFQRMRKTMKSYLYE